MTFSLSLMRDYRGWKAKLALNDLPEDCLSPIIPDGYNLFQVNDESSRCEVSHGVPQGSVLETLPFTLYMLPVGNSIRKHALHFYCNADDTDIFLKHVS